MIIYIGIGIILIGVFLFLYKILKDKTFLINPLKEKIAEKKAEQKAISELKREARLQALTELQPKLVKKYKEEELKKMTGVARKEKLEKFANAFKMNSGENNSGGMFDVNKLMGSSQNSGLSNDKIGDYIGLKKNNNQQPGIDNNKMKDCIGLNNHKQSSGLSNDKIGDYMGFGNNTNKQFTQKNTPNLSQQKMKSNKELVDTIGLGNNNFNNMFDTKKILDNNENRGKTNDELTEYIGLKKKKVDTKWI